MRGLVGATINNLYLLKNHRLFALYIFAFPIMLAVYFFTENSQILSFAEVYLVYGIPLLILEGSITSFSNRWNVFENSWGISPNTVVLSRYILYVVFSLVCVLIWIMLPLYGRYGLENAAWGMGIDVIIVSGQLVCILFFPVVAILNPRQTSIAVVALFVAIFGSLFLGNMVLQFSEGNLWLTAAIIGGLYAVSASISVVFNNIHRGRTA